MGDRPVHKLPFGPKCHELFVILYSIFANLSDGPGQYTVILTGSLTKTNRENINVKYNIDIYLYIYIPFFVDAYCNIPIKIPRF